jgi:glycosyltransferase involved in cell wall biosynthesis
LPQDEYEIIVINDGTPDNSMQCVKELALTHPNIVIIEQENQGLSGARNTGLQNAQGEYVWFVDSDDWIESNCLKVVTDRLIEQQLDALHISAINVTNDKQSLRYNYAAFEGQLYSGQDILRSQKHQFPAQFTIYRKTLLETNHLTFYPRIFHEDMEFTPRAYYFAERVSYYSTPIYYYELGNNTSIMHIPSVKHAFDMLIVIQRLLDFINDKSQKSLFPAFATTMAQILNHAMRTLKLSGTIEQKRDFQIKLGDMLQLPNMLRNCSNPYFRMEAYMLHISPRLFMWFYDLTHIHKNKCTK